LICCCCILAIYAINVSAEESTDLPNIFGNADMNDRIDDADATYVQDAVEGKKWPDKAMRCKLRWQEDLAADIYQNVGTRQSYAMQTAMARLTLWTLTG
jgi:hypothetical protein